jgi:hypothetical protein
MYSTSTSEFECIIVDDASPIPVIIPNEYKNKLRLIRNNKQLGCGRSRTLAAKLATQKYLFTIDSHTDFEQGWDDVIKKNLKFVDNNTIIYFPLKISNTWDRNLYDFCDIRYGSLAYLYNPRNKNFLGVEQIVNTKIEPNCLHASYVIKRDYFLYLKGLLDVKYWGSDELILTIKILMTGGNIKLIQDVILTHVDLRSGMHIRNLYYIYYNILRIAKTLMSVEEYNEFLSFIDKTQIPVQSFKFLDDDVEEIEEFKKYYKEIFIHDFSWLKEKLNFDLSDKNNPLHYNALLNRDTINKRLENQKLIHKEWPVVKNTWEKADAFINSVASRGILSTTMNLIGIDNNSGEKVSEEIYTIRHNSCFGITGSNQCSQLKYAENFGHYCGACGCGQTKLAKLDGDGYRYTKLHYPYLECPLKKHGFSNYIEKKSILSIIITCCNEKKEYLNRTIDSIRKTAGNEPEIIIIDDASIIPIESNERVIRNDVRIGVGRSRHKGAIAASNQYLLITDGHMIFDNGWYENFIERAKTAKLNDMFCGTCLGLDEKDKDLSAHKGAYHGARIELYNEKENQILEGKWIPEKSEMEYEISCLMGALYFVRKDWFLKIRGLSDIKMWGSDEPFLSLKTLLCGGHIFLLKNVRAGHVFRDSAPYTTGVEYLVYNKIRMAKTLLPDELANKLIDKLPKDGNFNAAMKMCELEKTEIEEYKTYYKSIFIKDFYEFCKEYDIKLL